MKYGLTHLYDPVAQIALHHEAGGEDQDHDEDYSQARDVKLQEGIGVEAVGNDQEQVVHDLDEEKKDVERQSDGDGNRQAGNEYLLDFLAHSVIVAEEKERAGRPGAPPA